MFSHCNKLSIKTLKHTIFSKNSTLTPNSCDLRTFVAKCCRQNLGTFSADFWRLKSRIRRLFSLLECMYKCCSYCCQLSFQLHLDEGILTTVFFFFFRLRSSPIADPDISPHNDCILTHRNIVYWHKCGKSGIVVACGPRRELLL